MQIWTLDEATRQMAALTRVTGGIDLPRLSPRHDWISFSVKVDGVLVVA